MQDPSGGVPGALLHHVHLVSQFKFPIIPQMLQPENVVQYLVRAQQIVREAPVAWQYLIPPRDARDGSLYLMWQPTSRLGNVFATDGYVWASPETTHTKELRGYTIEFYTNDSGLIPATDQTTAHRRTRYKLVSTPNNQAVDPALELVHYTAAPLESRINVRQVQLLPEMKKHIAERRYLEQGGGLELKQFMLYDKGNWPHIAMPGPQTHVQGHPQQPPGPPMGMGMGRGAPMAGMPGARPPPSAQASALAARGGKRGQPSVTHVPGASKMTSAFVDQLLKDEQSHAWGDSLDFLTPRELSVMRYSQHHEWMEEILSSPYELSRIVPVSLGLRFGGELKELTDGLWSNEEEEKEGVDVDPERNKITKEQVEEFRKRVEAFVTKGETELSNMRRVHEEKMEEMSQQKLFANLERRLAEASDESQADEIVREAEAAVKAPITRGEPVVCVAKGGLLDSSELNPPVNQDEFEEFTNMDTAGEALDLYDDNVDMDFTN